MDQRIAKELLDPHNERFISNLPRRVIADFEVNTTIWNLIQHTGGLICEDHHVCGCPFLHPTLQRGPRNCQHWHKYTEAREGDKCRSCDAKLVPFVPMQGLHEWQLGVGLRVTSADGGRSKQLVEIGRGSPGEIQIDEKGHYSQFGKPGQPQVVIQNGNGSHQNGNGAKKENPVAKVMKNFGL